MRSRVESESKHRADATDKACSALYTHLCDVGGRPLGDELVTRLAVVGDGARDLQAHTTVMGSEGIGALPVMPCRAGLEPAFRPASFRSLPARAFSKLDLPPPGGPRSRVSLPCDGDPRCEYCGTRGLLDLSEADRCLIVCIQDLQEGLPA